MVREHQTRNDSEGAFGYDGKWGRVSNYVVAGLVPAIHVFLVSLPQRRGCPGQSPGM